MEPWRRGKNRRYLSDIWHQKCSGGSCGLQRRLFFCGFRSMHGCTKPPIVQYIDRRTIAISCVSPGLESAKDAFNDWWARIGTEELLSSRRLLAAEVQMERRAMGMDHGVDSREA